MKKKVEMAEPPVNVKNNSNSNSSSKFSFIGYNVNWFKDPLITHMSALFRQGYERPLEDSDLGTVPEEDGVQTCKMEFHRLWEDEVQAQLDPSKRSLYSVLLKFIGYKQIGM